MKSSLSAPATRRDRLASAWFPRLTALAAALTVGLLALVLACVVWQGRSAFRWEFLAGGAHPDLSNPQAAGVLPMFIGTVARVLLMSLFVIPGGVITAIYLTEYPSARPRLTRAVRGAVSSLAGVPSIVFGLFGLGFFVSFAGGSLDRLFGDEGGEPVWSKPGLLWASLTLAVMTFPFVIVATEDALRAIPAGLREASWALGATRLQTIVRVVLPAALPGILAGGILAMSRAAGEVAPILFTGAVYYMARLPQSLTDPFMDLGYHAFVLATQTPNPEATRPALFATVLVLLALTLVLNLVAVFIRARKQRTSAEIV